MHRRNVVDDGTVMAHSFPTRRNHEEACSAGVGTVLCS